MFPRRSFLYWLDPICLGSIGLFAVNRWILKPHHIGGAFTQGYLNDVICLPLFLPLILGVQRSLGVRRHNGSPRLWEVIQHAIVFSIIFEMILPRYPHIWRTTADPLDAFCYFFGGIVAWVIWRRVLYYRCLE